MKILDLHPVRIYVEDIPDEKSDRISLIDEVYNIRYNNPLGIERSNLGGWHSPNNLMENPKFNKLNNIIIDIINNQIIENDYELLKNMKLIVDKIECSWAIINNEKDGNQTHTHAGNWLSGCFYIKAPSYNLNYQGNIGLLDQVSARVHESEPFRSHHSEPYYIEPKEGRLVIFPSWMSHQVTPNFTNEDRISYSFNITYQIQNYWKVRDDR